MLQQILDVFEPGSSALTKTRQHGGVDKALLHVSSSYSLHPGVLVRLCNHVIKEQDVYISDASDLNKLFEEFVEKLRPSQDDKNVRKNSDADASAGSSTKRVRIHEDAKTVNNDVVSEKDVKVEGEVEIRWTTRARRLSFSRETASQRI